MVTDRGISDAKKFFNRLGFSRKQSESEKKAGGLFKNLRPYTRYMRHSVLRYDLLVDPLGYNSAPTTTTTAKIPT
jgi:hypothetical protein